MEKNPHTLYEKLFYPETVAKFIGQDIEDIYESQTSGHGKEKEKILCMYRQTIET